MDAQSISVAKACLKSAHDASMSFPDIVRALAAAGIESYCVDYRRRTTTYYAADGDSVVLENPLTGLSVAAAFDRAAISAQIAWAQKNPSDYSYEAFCRNVTASGCAGYIVSFSGRRALYFGRTAETHTEPFP